MSKQQVKIVWPFAKREKAQLIWVGEPFRYDHKMMIKTYFRSQGRTERILMDWGTLPCLAIQHFYTDGIITASEAPEDIQEIDFTIYPNKVKYHERPWSIQGSNDPAISRSFVFSFNGKKIILPVIEVVRSILAPNVFLLYRLFESNSFPQFFTETYGPNKIHLSFTSQYELNYTKTAFIYQLVWLLTNRDLRETYENIAFTWLQERALKFGWNFTKPITITARVKEKNGTFTVLQIINVKNKDIPYQHISIAHPEIQDQEKSDEAKKYTYRSLNRQGNDEEGFTLDEKLDGSKEDFDLVQMNQLKHEYTSVPRIERIKRSHSKQRMKEDENTKKYYINHDSIRSTADSGGQQLARGLEHQMLHEIKAEGELQGFINVLKVLEQYPMIGTIQVVMDVLPDGHGKRRFTKLSDNVTKRRYVIAQIYLGNGKQFNIIEIERENRSLSLLILSSLVSREWKPIYDRLLINLVNDSGTWTSKSLKSIKDQGITVVKAKHSSKGVQHRAEILLNKLEHY
ncbi:Tn7-like element transposition protein TnsE [Alkalihalophilus marmarensis]|uniref:Tn7-like element transposition protein TnsE n=1 Tax=Alkalihalophilus marmarensis TaxID=521377 RepID=UPI00204155C4|nr:Tn7-like element transposition protein TnsE [Alkalihalophilus marmarensis]MCM3490998.1 Tn7-like element transposition protein TnsE [Alkalihalophilus marmarensis]